MNLECLDGTFGHGCSSICPCNRTAMSGSCHHETGLCSCIAGWMGNGFQCNESMKHCLSFEYIDFVTILNTL